MKKFFLILFFVDAQNCLAMDHKVALTEVKKIEPAMMVRAVVATAAAATPLTGHRTPPRSESPEPESNNAHAADDCAKACLNFCCPCWFEYPKSWRLWG